MAPLKSSCSVARSSTQPDVLRAPGPINVRGNGRGRSPRYRCGLISAVRVGRHLRCGPAIGYCLSRQGWAGGVTCRRTRATRLLCPTLPRSRGRGAFVVVPLAFSPARVIEVRQHHVVAAWRSRYHLGRGIARYVFPRGRLLRNMEIPQSVENEIGRALRWRRGDAINTSRRCGPRDLRASNRGPMQKTRLVQAVCLHRCGPV